MNLKHRQTEIAKVNLCIDKIQNNLEDISKNLNHQLKWMKIDEQSMKDEFQDLAMQLNNSNESFKTKLVRKRNEINEKYAKFDAKEIIEEKENLSKSERSKGDSSNKELKEIDSYQNLDENSNVDFN